MAYLLHTARSCLFLDLGCLVEVISFLYFAAVLANSVLDGDIGIDHVVMEDTVLDMPKVYVALEDFISLVLVDPCDPVFNLVHFLPILQLFHPTVAKTLCEPANCISRAWTHRVIFDEVPELLIMSKQLSDLILALIFLLVADIVRGDHTAETSNEQFLVCFLNFIFDHRVVELGIKHLLLDLHQLLGPNFLTCYLRIFETLSEGGIRLRLVLQCLPHG